MEKKECENPTLCTALGFWMPVLGLLLAAIINGAEGLKKALMGMLARYVILLCVLYWVLKLKFMNES